jgi:hypothetical protein
MRVGRRRSTRFSFAGTGAMGSFGRVKRPKLRGFLIVALLICSGFAAWTWFRPYAWDVDPAARCKVMGAQVRKDLSFFWVDVHLKVTPGQSHDLLKPVRLRTADGRELEPADTTLSGAEGQGTTDLWFKFWLESRDLTGPLVLRINDGTLVLKANPGMPALGSSNLEYFVTNHW